MVGCLLSYMQDLNTRRTNGVAGPSLRDSIQSRAAREAELWNREILMKLEVDGFKNVAHRTGPTIFSGHC